MKKLTSWLVALFCAGLIQTVAAQDSVTTVAGQALVSGFANGLGTNALFSDPAGIAIDLGGNRYVADSRNHAIRKIAPNGLVSTLAGQVGIAGNRDGIGAQAQFDS